MPKIHELVPNAEDLLSMEPEELGLILLKHVLTSPEPSYGGWRLKRGNFFLASATPALGYAAAFRTRVNEALMGGWIWLEREGFFLPAPDNQDRDWVVVSARGKSMLEAENFEAYKASLQLPRKTLHPAIAASTFALFTRGHYDTVVFEAYRAVEIAVREACGFPQDIRGTDLMRKAFNVSTGPLTDPTLVTAEQEAMSNLFAGAIGLFKNPASHRANTVTKPEDAVSLVMLANYMLRVVDERRAMRGDGR